MKKRNQKGFTIMEMLIVVAIIAILVAIAIPTFNSALTKSKEAADVANIRAAYAEVMMAYMMGDTTTAPTAKTVKDKAGNLNVPKNFTSKDTDTTVTYVATKLENSKDKTKTFTWSLTETTSTPATGGGGTGGGK